MQMTFIKLWILFQLSNGLLGSNDLAIDDDAGGSGEPEKWPLVLDATPRYDTPEDDLMIWPTATNSKVSFFLQSFV